MKRCRICHKPLKDSRSTVREMGPICFIKNGAQLDMFSAKPPSYSYHIRSLANMEILCIVDEFKEEDPTLTVTNGAELVLAEIANKLGRLPELIIYRDTTGTWDRLKAKANGEFLGFAPIVKGLVDRPTNEEQAIQLAVTAADKQKGSIQ